MSDELFTIIGLLHLLAAFSFIGTVILVVKLYLETDRGWYWLGLVLSIFLLAISEWFALLVPSGFLNLRILGMLVSEASQIIGAMLLAVSFYGMYITMKSIRKRVE